MTFENVDTSILGSAKKMIIGKDDTVIIDGAGDKQDVLKRIDSIQSEMEHTTSEYDKEKLQER